MFDTSSEEDKLKKKIWKIEKKIKVMGTILVVSGSMALILTLFFGRFMSISVIIFLALIGVLILALGAYLMS